MNERQLPTVTKLTQFTVVNGNSLRACRSIEKNKFTSLDMVQSIIKHENHMFDDHETGLPHHDLILDLIFIIT